MTSITKKGLNKLVDMGQRISIDTTNWSLNWGILRRVTHDGPFYIEGKLKVEDKDAENFGQQVEMATIIRDGNRIKYFKSRHPTYCYVKLH